MSLFPGVVILLAATPQNYSITQPHSENVSSPAGNRTPVSRVTGGDTYHYTTEDVYLVMKNFIYSLIDTYAHQFKSIMENPGIDPGASRMQSERSPV